MRCHYGANQLNRAARLTRIDAGCAGVKTFTVVGEEVTISGLV